MRSAPALLMLMFSCAAACAAQRDDSAAAPEAADRSCQATPGGLLRIGALLSTDRPTIDGVLAPSEWTDDRLILNSSTVQQWRQIRGAQPHTPGPDDLRISIWMAHDGTFWYIAMKAVDDVFVIGPPQYAYSGDVFELLFAGTQVDSGLDMNSLKDRLHDQRALLQVQVPPLPVAEVAGVISDWRTDAALNGRLIDEGFEIRSLVHARTWTTEIAIPFTAFDEAARRRMLADQAADHTKIGLNYLDYDGPIARRSLEDNWGFKPDNVYALDPTESNVNIPKCMRPIVFASSR
jgi:hypothetical protein